MAGIFLRKTVMAPFIIFKWMLRASFVVLKIVFWMAKLFLLLFVLAVSGVSAVSGVTAGRE